jgi:hypothetical protein
MKSGMLEEKTMKAKPYFYLLLLALVIHSYGLLGQTCTNPTYRFSSTGATGQNFQSFTRLDPNGTVGGTITNNLNEPLRFLNLQGARESRVFRTLPANLNDNNWVAQCNASILSGNNPGHIAMALTAGNLEAWTSAVNCPNQNTQSICQQPYPNTNQNGIIVMFANFTLPSISDVTTQGTFLSVYTKVGVQVITPTNNMIQVPAAMINAFGIRLERLSLTVGRLSLLNATGSVNNEICFDIPANLTGLNTLQMGVHSASSPVRNLTADLNNYEIFDNCSVQGLNTPSINSTKNGVCIGESAQLSVNSVDPLATYTWYDSPNKTTPIGTGATIQVSPTTRTTYYLVATKTIGCGISITREATRTINVRATPVVNPISYSTLETCANQLILLENSTPNGIWSSDNPSIATVNANGVVIGQSGGTTTIRYTLTNSSSLCSASATVPVTIKSKVDAFAIIGNQLVCPNARENYTVTPIDAQARYYWIVDNGISLFHYNGQSTNIQITYPDAPGASYTVKAVAINQCGATMEVSLPVSVKTDVPNKPVLTCSPNNNCQTLSVSNASLPASGVSVSWTINGIVDPSLNGLTSITRPVDQQVFVTYTKNDCSYTDAYFEGYCIAGTSARKAGPSSNQNDYKTIEIFPNPNDGNFIINTSGYAGKAFIINSEGLVVTEFDLHQDQKQYNFSGKVAAGLYLLKTIENGEEKNIMFIVQ